jgi:hypothetical protein
MISFYPLLIIKVIIIMVVGSFSYYYYYYYHHLTSPRAWVLGNGSSVPGYCSHRPHTLDGYWF